MECLICKKEIIIGLVVCPGHDVVKVVRCKDCKEKDTCLLLGSVFDYNDYCSQGVKEDKPC